MNKISVVLRTLSIGTLCAYSVSGLSHGVVESPPSRQQFCGVESKPHEIFGQLTHEQCRPIFVKDDGSMENSIYNFMGVLTHTTGRQGRTSENLPANVCGFDSETWGGGKTPWDKAIDWPTSNITSGLNKFVWNITWGAHFGDTEEFAYWITKPGFNFNSTEELRWDDFESEPFCLLKYDDKTPNANPAVTPDKPNNKFETECVIPERAGRAVIYAEWGRNWWTYERFHTCIDVQFDGTPPPPPQIVAEITKLPPMITGEGEMILDGSQSTGEDLTYKWSLTAQDTSHYTIVDADKPTAKLIVTNTLTEQPVTVMLTVAQGGFTNKTTKVFNHYPLEQSTTYKVIGNVQTDEVLAAGDKIRLRLVDNNGDDYYIPNPALVLTSETALPQNWSYALAQAVNDKNSYSAVIGVLNSADGTVEPVKSVNLNKVYADNQSGMQNAYVAIEKQDVPVPQNCRVQKKAGASAYWMGYDIYASKAPIVLDFSNTAIDLSKVNIDQGVFFGVEKLSNNKLLINGKPNWVSDSNPGYIGFSGQNYAPLSTNLIAICQAG